MNLFSEAEQCSFTAEKKPFFPPFLDTKQTFAMKIANRDDQQLAPLESWDQDGYMSLGLGYHQIQNIELEFYSNQGEYLDRLISRSQNA